MTVRDNVKIAAKSAVMSSLPENGSYGGCPAVTINDFHKQTIFMRKIIKSN